ncbi:MAG: T9SS type A sorting domain-containing protein [Lewinellaceae bacterium]|nr:T9SS type A sorting domain-containing protein [Lewinellaceae bacterium]
MASFSPHPIPMVFTPLRLFVLCLLICLAANLLSGQQTFQRAFGAADIAIAASDILATAGGYVLAGTSNSSVNLPGPQYKPFLMKIDTAGDLVWLRHYGPAYQAGFRTVIEANDGGYLAIGELHGISSMGNGEILVVKTDTDGMIQWQQVIPSYLTGRRNVGDWVRAVPGGYIISGRSSQGDSHAVLVRIDNQGNTVWSKRCMFYWGEDPRFHAFSVSGDTIFAVGRRDTFAAFNLFDAANGNILFHHAYDGPADYETVLHSMTAGPNGSWMTAGAAYPPNNPKSIQLVCRTGRTGNLIWAKTYPNVGYGPIAPLSDGNFLLIPRRYEPQNANLDPTLVKISADGAVLWSYEYALDGSDYFAMAIEAPDGGIIAAGAVKFPGQPESILVVKTDANGQVTQCCSQQVSTSASPLSITVSTADMMQVTFDTTWNVNLPEMPGSLTKLDYCPPVPGYQEIFLCPGDSFVVDGKSYTSPGFVTTTVSGPNCDTNLVYNIRTGVNPKFEKTVYFCPGDSITLHGVTYTQPGTYTSLVPSATGRCDTMATYIVEHTVLTSPSSIAANCPPDTLIQIPFGTQSALVTYLEPDVWSTCACPGIQLVQTQGLPSGNAFVPGDHTLCFEAQDSCGNQSACCFQIRISADDAHPCDEKTNDCIHFELLRISLDAENRRSYHFRIQNNCSQPLVYVAFQLPKGVVAVAPSGNSVYTTPGGRQYAVRNPNYSPLYSIRFETQATGIKNGESDVFTVTLPPFSAPDYFNSVVRLHGQSLTEAHLNTFNCPPESDAASQDRSDNWKQENQLFRISPNPVENRMTLEWDHSDHQPVQIQVYNAQGRLLLTREMPENQLVLELDLPAGIYFVQGYTASGKMRSSSRFVVR